MAYIIADNIISPLGHTTADNVRALLAGASELARHDCGTLGVGEDFVTARIPAADIPEADGSAPLSRFERKVLSSVRAALAAAPAGILGPRTLLVLSTTKGDIESLAPQSRPDDVAVGHAALRLSRALGLEAKPVVVCNACISGLHALILAQRLIDQRRYDHAIVCGTDDVARFVVAGFQSLKALSPESCRPFDIERTGLNLGEAVATAILSATPTEGCWTLEAGAVRNDAYHISAPSKTAEGQLRCLHRLHRSLPEAPVGFVSLHGTATLFNDQMESIALKRADLLGLPANSCKGTYGHTLGAAGVLETILSMHAADAGIVPLTRGYGECGVSAPVNVSADNRPCGTPRFVKMLSGFGGCNAAARFVRAEANAADAPAPPSAPRLRTLHTVSVTPDSVTVDGEALATNGETGHRLLTWLYKTQVADYPKFYKMDPLCRLGFIASELLLKAERAAAGTPADAAENRAVLLFNEHSSLAADRAFLDSIAGTEGYFPSPSVFVYTLPNIVTGEVAIRNGYHGETSFCILPAYDSAQMLMLMQAAAADTAMRSILGGWVDYVDESNFLARLAIYDITSTDNHLSDTSYSYGTTD